MILYIRLIGFARLLFFLGSNIFLCTPHFHMFYDSLFSSFLLERFDSVGR